MLDSLEAATFELGTDPAAEAPTLVEPVLDEDDGDEAEGAPDKASAGLLSVLFDTDADDELGDTLFSKGPLASLLFAASPFPACSDVWDFGPGEVFGRLPRLRAITVLPFEFDMANSVRRAFR